MKENESEREVNGERTEENEVEVVFDGHVGDTAAVQWTVNVSESERKRMRAMKKRSEWRAE